MKTFTLSELGNKSGEVTEAAFRGPVNITSRGKRKFVILTAEDYDRLATRPSVQRVVHVDDLTDAQADDYITGLSAVIEKAQDD